MKFFMLLPASLLLFSMMISAQAPKQLFETWDKNRLSTIQPSQVKHEQLKRYLEGLRALGLPVEEVGRSFENREIYQIQFGKGETKIFMWSQMHGNEPTATSALIDMLAFLQKNKDKDWVKRIEEKLTIRAVPMLNPDGAEVFTRRNAQQIDINRDAQALETPEGRLLKKLRDDWQPEIGFNLHNQNIWTSVGDTKKQASLSFLVVLGNADGLSSTAHERNKRICALMIGALNNYIPGNIGRYDETFNPVAFGDNFSAWGTPTILIETGGLHGKDEMYLVRMNFIAYLTALNAIADGTEKNGDEAVYENIPLNSSGRLFNVLVKNAGVINLDRKRLENGDGGSAIETPLRFSQPFTADIGINFERRRTGAIESTFVREIGDLSNYGGFEQIDASNYYVVTADGELNLGSREEIHFYKRTRKIDWSDPNFPSKNKPDAVFANGKLSKPLR